MHYDLLVHVDLPDATRMSMALTNIENYKKALVEQEYTVVVLANAGAVQFFVKDNATHAQSMQDLAAQGIVFKACQNALNKASIKAEELLPFVQIVPAGIVEVVDLQRQGYAYIKP